MVFYSEADRNLFAAYGETMNFRAFCALSIQVVFVTAVMSPAGVSPAVSQSEGFIQSDVPVQQQFADWPPPDLLHRNYWFPWSWRTFQRASLFNRPVFLLIDSRWNLNAHHAREELLGDATIQERLNQGYITIYVNADERPDIVERYQTGTMPVMSLLLPSGNPLITKNTPTGEGMPITIGAVDLERMLFLLEQGNIYYDMWTNFLTHVGQEWAGMVEPEDPISGEVDSDASDEMFQWMSANWDRTDGGFGLAPKYLIPGLPEYARIRKARYLPAAAELTANYLPRMLSSPLHDTVHGGVHRMAAGPDWSEIQYEKLLDRNAIFLHQVTLAFLDDPVDTYRQAAIGAGRFIMENLEGPQGGFYLGQTADFESEDGGGYWKDPEQAGTTPEVDRLVLSASNAQAGAALIRAGIVLDRPEMVASGRRALDRVLKEGYRVGRGVRHVLAPSPSDHIFLETQADVAFFLLSAYQSTGERRYYDASLGLVEFCINNFRLPGEIRFRDHIPDSEPIGLLNTRRMPFRANIQLARTMIRLGHLGAGKQLFLEAEDLLAEYTGSLSMFRNHGVIAGLAVEESMAKPLIVTLLGDPSSEPVQTLRRTAVQSPLSWMILVQDPAGTEGSFPGPKAVVTGAHGTVDTGDPKELAGILRDLASIRPKGVE